MVDEAGVLGRVCVGLPPGLLLGVELELLTGYPFIIRCFPPPIDHQETIGLIVSNNKRGLLAQGVKVAFRKTLI